MATLPTHLRRNQRERLLARAVEWVAEIQRLNQQAFLRYNEAAIGRPSEGESIRFEQVHYYVLCLKHLLECVTRVLPLSDAGATAACRKFVDLAPAFKNLRDALEHEEEYLAGTGRHPATIIGPVWKERGYQMAPGFAFNPFGIVEVAFFGHRYDLFEVVQAAQDLQGHLSAELQMSMSGRRRPPSVRTR